MRLGWVRTGDFGNFSTYNPGIAANPFAFGRIFPIFVVSLCLSACNHEIQFFNAVDNVVLTCGNGGFNIPCETCIRPLRICLISAAPAAICRSID